MIREYELKLFECLNCEKIYYDCGDYSLGSLIEDVSYCEVCGENACCETCNLDTSANNDVIVCSDCLEYKCSKCGKYDKENGDYICSLWHCEECYYESNNYQEENEE